MIIQRSIAAAAAALIFAANTLPATATAPKRPVAQGRAAVLARGTISGNRTVSISRAGIASITSADRRHMELRSVPLAALTFKQNGQLDPGQAKSLVKSLDVPPHQPYVPGAVNVVFRDGAAPYQDAATFPSVASASTALEYSADSRVNAVFAKLGVDRIVRIGRFIDRSRMASMHSRASVYDRSALNLGSAYQIHVTDATVTQAVRALRALPSIAYASPDWILSSTNVRMQPLAQPTGMPAAHRYGSSSRWARFASAQTMNASPAMLPSNYGLTTSMQSYLNAPGIDAAAAYDEVQKAFRQLPGQGEIITDVGIGDVCTAPGDVTSHLIGMQHYLDAPALPLIPEYVVNPDGFLSGSAEACGTADPSLSTILLNFSVMASLPEDLQRGSEIGSGPTDFLGIAPGASYRLVVPQGTATVSALVATFLAAADQTPAPNVITASIWYPFTDQGFPSRFLEEDPMVRSAISTIVNADNIVVCISAGDGLGPTTNAALSPTGGSAPTNLVQSANQLPTNLNDVAFSTVPSTLVDSGSIDVGGTTTDDILSVNPYDPANAQFVNQLAFPAVRWNGMAQFSSGFGSRVNISAPSDNIPTMFLAGLGYDAVVPTSYSSGGTSASASMVAAAAAVMLQVARLTGHPFAKATDVRAHLIANAVPVPNVPQADMTINVGPQVNVRRGVEQLLVKGGITLAPSVGRVAVAQRTLYLGGSYCPYEMPGEQSFYEATDPTYIRLDGLDQCGQIGNRNLNSPITIAPDWEGVPTSAHYRLYVTGHRDQVLGTGPWQRIFPKQLFQVAQMPGVSPSPRTISLTYEATVGFHIAASSTFDLTFGPTPATTLTATAPRVAPVIDSSNVKPCMSYPGNCFTVAYDLSNVPAAAINSAVLEVSNPGRVTPDFARVYYPIWTSPVLTATSGNVEVPVSALGGGGIYGIAINLSPNPSIAAQDQGLQSYSVPAFVRVVPTQSSSARPAAPLLSLPGDAIVGIPSTHNLTIAHGGTFIVSYDVSNVPGATSAQLEFSAPGPNFFNGNQNTFNNPNGSTVDNNGNDTGSTSIIALSSTTGSITLTDVQAHLVPGMSHVVRVIPMNGSNYVGEASDVSTVSDVGIATPDGNSLVNGFAIDTAGDDGVYTTAGPLFGIVAGAPPGTVGSLIGTFSQSTGQLSLNAYTAVGDPYVLLGYVGSDSIVFQQGAVSPADAQLTQGLAPRAASLQSTAVTPPSSWGGLTSYFPALPDATWYIREAGQNTSSAMSAILCQQSAGAFGYNFGVFSANVGVGSSTAFVPLNPTSWGGGAATGSIALIDYDPSANVGYVLLNGATPFGTNDDVLATVNFGTNSVSYADLGDQGVPLDFVIDPATHVGAMSSTGPGFFGTPEVILLNLATASVASQVTIPTWNFYGIVGGGLTKLAVDPIHGLFAVQNIVPAVDQTDNNPLSEVDFINETGSVVSKTPRYYNLSTFTVGDHWFQLNPTTRTGFMDGPNFTQIIPFPY